MFVTVFSPLLLVFFVVTRFYFFVVTRLGSIERDTEMQLGYVLVHR